MTILSLNLSAREEEEEHKRTYQGCQKRVDDTYLVRRVAVEQQIDISSSRDGNVAGVEQLPTLSDSAITQVVPARHATYTLVYWRDGH